MNRGRVRRRGQPGRAGVRLPFDTPGYARNLKAACVRMWGTYLAGKEPHAIEL